MHRDRQEVSLEPQDILLFEQYLKKDLQRLFPAANISLYPVNCLPDPGIPFLSEDRIAEHLSAVAPVVDKKSGSVFLPLVWKDTLLGIAVVKDPAGMDMDMLAGQWPKVGLLILEKARLYKAYLTDAESGALSLALFKDAVTDLIESSRKDRGDTDHSPALASGRPFSIIFLELLSRPLGPGAGKNGQSQSWPATLSALREGLKDIPLFYLFRPAKSTLAVVIPFCDREKGKRISSALFQVLRKRRVGRTGLVTARSRLKFALAFFSGFPGGPEKDRKLTPEQAYALIMERGEEALAVAKSRPDYPICFSSELEETESLKMVKGIHQATDQLKNKWKKVNNFCLALAKYDPPIPPFTKGGQGGFERVFSEQGEEGILWGKIRSWLSPGQSILSCGQETFLFYLPGIKIEEALRAGRQLQHRIKEKSGRTVSMGLASYPVLKYKKEEIPFNAYKALVHTQFFGPDTITAFDAVSLNISGDMLFNAGHLPGAIAEYKKGLALEPQNINLLNSLGVCYAELKWHKRAVSCFEKALAGEQDSFMAHYNLGSVYLKVGMPDKALIALEQAAMLNGNHFDVLFQLGKVLQEQKRWDEALHYFERAARCPDAKGCVYRYWGDTYRALNLGKEAMAAFKKAVKASPNDAFSLSCLGLLYAEVEKDFEIARTLCAKALELDPGNGLYWKAMGRSYYLKEDYDQAIRHLKEAQGRTKKDPEVYYHLGLAYEKTGKVAAARKKWRRALKMNPLFKEAQTALQSIDAVEK